MSVLVLAAMSALISTSAPEAPSNPSTSRPEASRCLADQSVTQASGPRDVSVSVGVRKLSDMPRAEVSYPVLRKIGDCNLVIGRSVDDTQKPAAPATRAP